MEIEARGPVTCEVHLFPGLLTYSMPIYFGRVREVLTLRRTRLYDAGRRKHSVGRTIKGDTS